MCVTLNLSILKGLGEAAIYGREVAGEGVTYVMPLCARADRKSAIIFECHRSAQKQNHNA